MKLLILLSLVVSSFSLHAKEDSSKNIEAFIKKNKNVLVHVHASWCPSCKVQKKILDSLNRTDYKLLEVDFDSDKQFLKENKVFTQSMLISFVDSKEKSRVFGITKKEKITDYLNKNFSGSLQERINKRRNASKVPSADRMTMEQATKKLKDSGIIDKALSKGKKYIDFSLPNIHGKTVKLSDKLKDGPIVLTFYRGGWCPYCNIQLKAYQENLDAFKKAGGQLIAVSPESMESATTTVKKHDIDFEILTDKLNKEARKYGLVFKLEEDLKAVYLKFGLDLKKNQGNDSWELPIPATYVINQQGEIVYSFLNVDYVQRAEPADIIEALNKLK